jgi:hypothetical protein
MKKRYKTMWLKALRSGKYKQGKGALVRHGQRGGKKYCCLGVLAEIVDPSFDTTTDGNHAFLNHSFCSKVGLSRRKSGLGASGTADPKSQGFYANLNDNGVSFKRIANEIEKNL